jgi:mono/diheme cytochrome c family protein
MKFLSLVSFVCLALLLSFPPVGSAQESESGKKLFLDNKCNSCHAVESRGIQKKGAASSGEKKGPPDLSGIGSARKAEWLTGYMKKENDIQGKKHIKAWTGNDEDLATIVKWMESLKKK